MSLLTLKLDCYIYTSELKDYMKSLNGVSEVKITNSNNEIYIEYDSNLISIEMMKLEITLFLDILRIPSIVAFDKHSKSKLTNYNLIIKDICCEFCLKNMIDDLLFTNGVESLDSNPDDYFEKNIPMSIKYDEKIINKEEIDKVLKDWSAI